MSQMIPVRLIHDPLRILCQDVSQADFTQATFDRGLPQDGATLEWSLDELRSSRNPESSLRPGLFVFHMSRCGSTLLARVLAKSPRHFVISEADIINQLLYLLAEENVSNPPRDPQSANLLRNLILEMTRDLGVGQQRFFVKFSSWNILLLPLIQRAFPHVPCLFLYRRPEEVLVSGLSQPPSFLADKDSEFGRDLSGVSLTRIRSMPVVEYGSICLRRMMIAALASNVRFLNYDRLTPKCLARTLDHFHLPYEPQELATMQAAFQVDSKRDTRFEDDRERKQRAVTPEIRESVARLLEGCYQRMEQSPRNLFHDLNAS